MRLLFIILPAFIVSTSYSQQQFITIEGVVKDFESTSINALTVKVQHSTNGTSTSANGTFQLNGIRLGDTLVFSGASWQMVYFVVDRRYNVLNFTMVRDTGAVYIKENERSSYFEIKKLFPSYSYSKLSRKVVFSETSTTVTDVTEFDKDRVYTKVEVTPYFYTKYPKFTDSLESDINKLDQRYKPKKAGSIMVYLWIRGDKKIEVSSIAGNIHDMVKEVIRKRFESITNIFPAIQNGRYVGFAAVAAFQIDIGSGKNIQIKTADQQ